MMPTVNISETTFARLQKLAIPLVDDIDSVISKLLDGADAPVGPVSAEPRVFNPSAPPNLAFASVKSATIGGAVLDKSLTNWNGVMLETIKVAVSGGAKPSEVLDVLTINAQKGKREDSGYKYVAEADLSVQGQDANAAFRQARKVATQFAIPLDIRFAWSEVEKAANPGMKGQLKV